MVLENRLKSPQIINNLTEVDFTDDVEFSKTEEELNKVSEELNPNSKLDSETGISKVVKNSKSKVSGMKPTNNLMEDLKNIPENNKNNLLNIGIDIIEGKGYRSVNGDTCPVLQAGVDLSKFGLNLDRELGKLLLQKNCLDIPDDVDKIFKNFNVFVHDMVDTIIPSKLLKSFMDEINDFGKKMFKEIFGKMGDNFNIIPCSNILAGILNDFLKSLQFDGLSLKKKRDLAYSSNDACDSLTGLFNTTAKDTQVAIRGIISANILKGSLDKPYNKTLVKELLTNQDYTTDENVTSTLIAINIVLESEDTGKNSEKIKLVSSVVDSVKKIDKLNPEYNIYINTLYLNIIKIINNNKEEGDINSLYISIDILNTLKPNWEETEEGFSLIKNSTNLNKGSEKFLLTNSPTEMKIKKNEQEIDEILVENNEKDNFFLNIMISSNSKNENTLLNIKSNKDTSSKNTLNKDIVENNEKNIINEDNNIMVKPDNFSNKKIKSMIKEENNQNNLFSETELVNFFNSDIRELVNNPNIIAVYNEGFYLGRRQQGC